jgi:hypothetical protein
LHTLTAELANGSVENRAKSAGRSWPILWHYIDPILDRLAELGHGAYPFGLATTNDVFNAPNQDIDDIIAIVLLVHLDSILTTICHCIATFYVCYCCVCVLIKYDQLVLTLMAKLAMSRAITNVL